MHFADVTITFPNTGAGKYNSYDINKLLGFTPSWFKVIGGTLKGGSYSSVPIGAGLGSSEISIMKYQNTIRAYTISSGGSSTYGGIDVDVLIAYKI